MYKYIRMSVAVWILCSIPSLQYVLNPTFGKELISQQDIHAKMSRAFDGTKYLPGRKVYEWCLTSNVIGSRELLKN